MGFLKIDIYTETQAIELLTARISDLGITGFIIHDSADFDEFLKDKDINWDYIDDDLMNLKNQPVYITCYIPDDAQGMDLFAALKDLTAELKSNSDGFYGSLEMATDTVYEEDWANNWKQYYKPLCVGEKLLIKPTWESVPEYAKGRLILEIDPASAFGTGQHHTTQLCLELLEKNVKKNDRVLDLGCGSGILSVAALLLGAKEVTMVDIFENAVKTASENAEQNNFDKSNYRAFSGNITDDAELCAEIGSDYDIVTANIVAGVIIDMSSIFNRFIKKSGIIIISGIISERLDEVIQALNENYIKVQEVSGKGGWHALLCTL